MVTLAMTIEIEADGDYETVVTTYPMITNTINVEADRVHEAAGTTYPTTVMSAITIQVEAGSSHEVAIHPWYQRRRQATFRRWLPPGTRG